MSAKFIISHLDEQLGPFDEAELKARWVKGEILPIDYVFDDAKQDWVLVSERFPWASAKAEMATPPPLREMPVRKTRGPDPVASVATVAPVTPVAAVVPVAAAAPVAIAPPSPSAAPVAIAIVTGNENSANKKNVVPGAKVKLTDGVGEIDLSPLEPGHVELVLQDSSAGTLRLQNPLKIHVRPAEPYALEWTLVEQQTVGQDLEIHIQALDRSGHLCSHYEDQFSIRVNGAEGKEINVPMREGQALIKIQHTKSESWRLSFHYNGSRVLKMPADRNLEWQPGPATKLILDGPQEYVAGHPLKVHVKAVDNWGNLATTFQGTVILEVKAS